MHVHRKVVRGGLHVNAVSIPCTLSVQHYAVMDASENRVFLAVQHLENETVHLYISDREGLDYSLSLDDIVATEDWKDESPSFDIHVVRRLQLWMRLSWPKDYHSTLSGREAWRDTPSVYTVPLHLGLDACCVIFSATLYGSEYLKFECKMNVLTSSLPLQVSGLQGTYLVNRYNRLLVDMDNPDTGPMVSTVISYNKGGQWGALAAPAVDKNNVATLCQPVRTFGLTLESFTCFTSPSPPPLLSPSLSFYTATVFFTSSNGH